MSTYDLRGRRVLVTGGLGFLGQHVVARLRGAGARVEAPPRSRFDLLEQAEVRRMMARARPEVVVHLAGTVGGIGFTRRHPARAFYENAMMSAMVIHEAWLAGAERFLGAGSVCSYPKLAPVPTREEHLWLGEPEETNAPYGVAKRGMVAQARAYRREHGMDASVVIMANLYGPGDDLDPETSHVIPALFRRFREARAAGAEEVTLWGDGTPTREFLYVEDAAMGVAAALGVAGWEGPVNLGSSGEVSVAELAEMIARLVGWRGRISWDASMPGGQPRRAFDSSLALRTLGWRAVVPLEEGLRRTLRWLYEVEAASEGRG